MTTHYIEQCIEDDGTNSYTDIRNHLSPSTIVIEENLQEQFQMMEEAVRGEHE